MKEQYRAVEELYCKRLLTLPEKQAIDANLLSDWFFFLSFFTFMLNLATDSSFTGIMKRNNREKSWTLCTEMLRFPLGLMNWGRQERCWVTWSRLVSNVSLCNLSQSWCWLEKLHKDCSDKWCLVQDPVFPVSECQYLFLVSLNIVLSKIPCRHTYESSFLYWSNHRFCFMGAF